MRIGFIVEELDRNDYSHLSWIGGKSAESATRWNTRILAQEWVWKREIRGDKRVLIVRCLHDWEIERESRLIEREKENP